VVSDAWFAPYEIHFTLEQVEWIMENMEELMAGVWPPEPTSYTDPVAQQHHATQHASFEKTIEVAGEVNARLENAGQDGAMCKMMYVYGEDIATIAKYWHLGNTMTEKRIDRALHYCCGWRRKGEYRQRG